MAKSPGMFAGDKMFGIPRLDETVALGERFVVWGAGQRATLLNIDSLDSPGEKQDVPAAWLIVSRIEGGEYQAPTLVQTIATAIVENAGQAIPEDFPAVCFTTKVASKQAGRSDAYVMNLDFDAIAPEGYPVPAESYPVILDAKNGAVAPGLEEYTRVGAAR